VRRVKGSEVDSESNTSIFNLRYGDEESEGSNLEIRKIEGSSDDSSFIQPGIPKGEKYDELPSISSDFEDHEEEEPTGLTKIPSNKPKAGPRMPLVEVIEEEDHTMLSRTSNAIQEDLEFGSPKLKH